MLQPVLSLLMTLQAVKQLTDSVFRVFCPLAEGDSSDQELLRCLLADVCDCFCLRTGCCRLLFDVDLLSLPLSAVVGLSDVDGSSLQWLL
jgi:hypothetical protein